MIGSAPIIVTALLDGEDQAWFDRQRAVYFPPERNFLKAHLTMFHHLPPSLEGEVRQRLGEAARTGAPIARVAGLMSLGRGVAYRIDSAGLEEVRAHLADIWAGLLTPQDQADPADARALLDRLKPDFRPRPLAIAGYAAWWYRGGPWEPLSRHMCA